MQQKPIPSLCWFRSYSCECQWKRRLFASTHVVATSHVLWYFSFKCVSPVESIWRQYLKSFTLGLNAEKAP